VTNILVRPALLSVINLLNLSQSITSLTEICDELFFAGYPILWYLEWRLITTRVLKNTAIQITYVQTYSLY